MADSSDYDKTLAAFSEGFRAIGEVVYFFQQLEEDLRRVVSFLIDPDDGTTANIVVHEQSFKQLVSLAWCLFEEYLEGKDIKNTDEWRLILSQALEAETRRNSLLHSTFGVSTEEEPIFTRSKVTAKFKKGQREVGEVLDDQTMRAYQQKMSLASNSIMEFMSRVFPRWNTREWNRE